MRYYYRKLNLERWHDFYELFQKHHQEHDGCWCAYYLGKPSDFVHEETQRHMIIHQEHLEQFGTTGILVYDEDIAVGYCQVAKSKVIERYNYYTGYDSLPKELKEEQNWRISCIFVDPDYRGKKVASKTYEFAEDYISKEGGGYLEVFPFEIDKIKKFEFNGTIDFYLKRGFKKIASIGKEEEKYLLMTKYIEGKKI